MGTFIQNRVGALGYVVVIVFLLFFILPRCVTFAQELYLVHLSSSPAEAYTEGTAYLEGEYPHPYNLERAQTLLRRTLELDPHYPDAHHQLSRIAFLQSDFPLALKLINQEILERGETASLSSHYVKGLILGYMSRFEEAAESYEVFLEKDTTNWAAQNDYAWVLMKLHRHGTALRALDTALEHWPQNAWLHSNRATALFELGRLEEAHRAAHTAALLSETVTEKEWLTAYPGNDPRIAKDGITALRAAAQQNLQRISAALSENHPAH